MEWKKCIWQWKANKFPVNDEDTLFKTWPAISGRQYVAGYRPLPSLRSSYPACDKDRVVESIFPLSPRVLPSAFLFLQPWLDACTRKCILFVVRAVCGEWSSSESCWWCCFYRLPPGFFLQNSFHLLFEETVAFFASNVSVLLFHRVHFAQHSPLHPG